MLAYLSLEGKVYKIHWPCRVSKLLQHSHARGKGEGMWTAEHHDYDERLESVYDGDFRTLEYNLERWTLNDKTYSAQPAVGLSTKFNLPAQIPVIDDDFRFGLEIKFVVQVKQWYVGQ